MCSSHAVTYRMLSENAPQQKSKAEQAKGDDDEKRTEWHDDRERSTAGHRLARPAASVSGETGHATDGRCGGEDGDELMDGSVGHLDIRLRRVLRSV